MLNPAAALCSLFTGHMIQTLLKIVRLLCITISVGRSRSSRSVKNVADTKLFAARSLQKASTDVFQGPPPQQRTKGVLKIRIV